MKELPSFVKQTVDSLIGAVSLYENRECNKGSRVKEDLLLRLKAYEETGYDVREFYEKLET